MTHSGTWSTAGGGGPEVAAPAAGGRTEHVRGGTVWLTGLPSAGKSTIAHAIADRIHSAHIEILDGDELRTHLSAGLGFSRADRETNIERVGWVAWMLARHGVLVLVAVVAPYTGSRDSVRARHAGTETEYVEIHVATPVEECAERDVKGLYAKQRAGELTGLTGVDDPYEAPEAPELRVETSDEDPQTSADRVVEVLRSKGIVR